MTGPTVNYVALLRTVSGYISYISHRTRGAIRLAGQLLLLFAMQSDW